MLAFAFFIIAYVFVSHFVIFTPYFLTVNTSLPQRFFLLAANLVLISLLRLAPDAHIAHAVFPNVLSIIGLVFYLSTRPKDYNLQLCLYFSTAQYMLSRLFFHDHVIPSTYFECDLLSLFFMFYEMYLYSHLSLLNSNRAVIYICLYNILLQPHFPDYFYALITLLRLASIIYLFPSSLRHIPALATLWMRFLASISPFAWRVLNFLSPFLCLIFGPNAFPRPAVTHIPNRAPMEWYEDPFYNPYYDLDFDPNTSYYLDQYCLYLRIRPGPHYTRPHERSTRMGGSDTAYFYFGTSRTTHLYFHHLAVDPSSANFVLEAVDALDFPPGTVFANFGRDGYYRLAHHSEAVPYFHYLSLTSSGLDLTLAVRYPRDADSFHAPIFEAIEHYDDENFSWESAELAYTSSSSSEEDFTDPSVSSAAA